MADSSTTAADEIVVTVPLRARYASTVRLLAASLAADVGFSVDEIDDLRLALSEAFALLVDGADAGDDDRAIVELRVEPRSVRASVRAASGRPMPAPDELAMTILRSVTDQLTVAGDRLHLVKLASETVA